MHKAFGQFLRRVFVIPKRRYQILVIILFLLLEGSSLAVGELGVECFVGSHIFESGVGM